MLAQGKPRRLSAEDLSILALENETIAGHTCKVIVLHGRIDLDLLRSSVGERLHLAPALCMRLEEIEGAGWWMPAPHVDVNVHVVERDAPGVLGEAEFTATVAAIFAQHLDRSRPLWRIDLIPRLAGGGSALVWRIHHALADGTTAMRMARAVLWDEVPGAAPHAGSARKRPPAAGEQAPAAHHRLGGLVTAIREAPQPWLRSPFDGHVDAQRSVAFTTVGLEELHRVARAAGGATVNDAVLTVVAGGLRRWLESHHGHLGAIRVKVPVSLHTLPLMSGDDGSGDGPEPGNRDSFFCVDLPLGSADPLERLTAIRHATRVRKQGHDAQHLDAIMHQLARTPRLREFAGRVLAHPRSFALNVSNVPGPRQPLRVLGIPVAALYALAEIGQHHALRVAVVSLAGTLSFGLVADPTLLADVDLLAADVQDEATALIACLSLTHPTLASSLRAA
ncbi:MAG TPA: wax ester/triacylglycerol synthase domain-containing protein [Streptosporangiaceae bacterium]|nr:wax ester/triacylglycerol synthase domain-containing protein [Streptosporangiaceae bacterium]